MNRRKRQAAADLEMPVAAAGEVEAGKGAGAEVMIDVEAAVGVGTGTDDGAAGIDTEAVSAGTEAAAGEEDTTQGVVIADEMSVPDTVVPGGATHVAKVAAPDIRKKVLSGNQNPS